MPIVDNTALLRLIEVELVSQYRRFLKKNLVVSPKTCRFNIWETTPEGGYIRMCRCPHVNSASVVLRLATEEVANKPCTTLSHAKKCPLYQHYTGAPDMLVVAALTAEFLLRLEDPAKRATSFKTLHTLWLILHETEAFHLGWFSRIQLKITAKLFNKKYQQYLAKMTPKADATWGKLSQNFRVALQTINTQE